MIKVQTCEFISVTDVVPRGWRNWFWETVAEDAPFSWGDNNRSLVTASAFADHCQARLDDSPRTRRFLERLRSLGEMYLDLES